MYRSIFRIALLLGLAFTLTACGLFGESANEPLPGKRIAILDIDRGLRPDPSIADVRVAVSEPYVNDAWTQYGGSPAHAMYHLALGESPSRVWTSDVGAGSTDSRQILAQPLVANGTVYTMDALSVITAFDAERGRVQWRVDLEPDDEDDGYFGGGIALDGDRIFVTTGFARILRSEERRGGKECRSRWAPDH